MSEYIEIYSGSHQNFINRIIHKICVPTIFFTILGMLHAIPSPISLSYLGYFVSLAFYFLTKTKEKYFILILVQLSLFHWLIHFYFNGLNFLWYLGIFVLAWIGQFIGHSIEGKRPSFLTDISYLLVGPVWVFYDLLDRKKD